MTSDVVTREIKIDAPPEAVFPYLVDPALAVKWHAVEADFEPQPGGRYHLNVTGRDVARGEFVEIDPPNRVVFTWGWEGSTEIPPGSSTVEMTLEADGDHTIVRLFHRGLPTEEWRARHAQGWEHYTARLATVAAGGDPGPDPWAQEHPS